MVMPLGDGPPLPRSWGIFWPWVGERYKVLKKKVFFKFLQDMTASGYQPSLEGYLKLKAERGPSWTGEEEREIEFMYTLWIIAENSEEAKRLGVMGPGRALGG